MAATARSLEHLDACSSVSTISRQLRDAAAGGACRSLGGPSVTPVVCRRRPTFEVTAEHVTDNSTTLYMIVQSKITFVTQTVTSTSSQRIFITSRDRGVTKANASQNSQCARRFTRNVDSLLVQYKHLRRASDGRRRAPHHHICLPCYFDDGGSLRSMA